MILPDCEIGRRTRLRRVVVDKHCRIPPDTVIGYDPVQDAKRFHVSAGGITLVTPDMLGQTVHYIR